jgi:hypothetical protein
MFEADGVILVELHQRLRLALKSADAAEAPIAMRRMLWRAAGILHRMLMTPEGSVSSPTADEIQDALQFVDETLDAWTNWLGMTKGARR